MQFDAFFYNYLLQISFFFISFAPFFRFTAMLELKNGVFF